MPRYPRYMRELMQQHLVAIVLGAFGLAVLLIGWAIMASVQRAKRRRAELRDWAFRSGYDYQEGPMPARELAPLKYFELTPNIVRADATNIARGSRLTLLDLERTHYTRSSGNSKSYSRKSTSCALFKLDEPLPRFSFAALSTAAPDTLQGKLMSGVASLAKFVGSSEGQPIPIPDRPGFLAVSHEPQKAAPLFADGRTHFFDDKCGFSVECEGSWMVVSCDANLYGQNRGWERSALVDAKNYDEFVRVATAVRDHFTQ
jgi:hypothetical protein